MINEIIKFENIGTPNYVIKLSHLIKNGSYNRSNINDFFINKLIDGNTVFDGGVCLLQKIDFLSTLDDGTLIISGKYQHFLKNDKLLVNKIVSLFIEKCVVDNSFHEIFNHDTVSHDVDLSIIIDNSAFQFKYSKLKQFLIDFKVMSTHPYKEYCFCVSKKYKRVFDKHILTIIKKRVLSLEEFQKLQNLKNKHGEDAEIFILNSERKKFHSHILIDAIEQISKIDSSAGYDVSSFQNKNSTNIDKFIEVKSYSEKPYFYWSLNEVEVAKKEQDNYFLYLVNRDEMNATGYEPLIIQNPYTKVFNNGKWKKTCQKWMFQNHSTTIGL